MTAERDTDVEMLEQIEAMFVQTANALISHGATLTLHGVSPSTLYFSDRPRRVVGHIGSKEFVALWEEGENSFAVDPPNAVLALADPADGAIDDVVLVLREPLFGDGTLTYRVQVLAAKLPRYGGPCSLFIDPFGRPLSPVSVAGMHRRSRRLRRRAL